MLLRSTGPRGPKPDRVNPSPLSPYDADWNPNGSVVCWCGAAWCEKHCPRNQPESNVYCGVPKCPVHGSVKMDGVHWTNVEGMCKCFECLEKRKRMVIQAKDVVPPPTKRAKPRRNGEEV